MTSIIYVRGSSSKHLANPVKVYLTLVAAGASYGDLDSPAAELRRFGLSVLASNEIVSARARERRLLRDWRKHDLAWDAETAGSTRARAPSSAWAMSKRVIWSCCVDVS